MMSEASPTQYHSTQTLKRIPLLLPSPSCVPHPWFCSSQGFCGQYEEDNLQAGHLHVVASGLNPKAHTSEKLYALSLFPEDTLLQ